MADIASVRSTGSAKWHNGCLMVGGTGTGQFPSFTLGPLHAPAEWSMLSEMLLHFQWSLAQDSHICENLRFSWESIEIILLICPSPSSKSCHEVAWNRVLVVGVWFQANLPAHRR